MVIRTIIILASKAAVLKRSTMTDYWRPASATYLSSLSGEQMDVVYAYKDYSDYFNKPLRDGILNGEVSSSVTNLTDIISNSPRPTSDIWVYRAYLNYVPQVGSTIVEKGFMSTSLDLDKAKRYIEGSANGSIIKLKLLSNVPALYVDAIVEHEDSDEEVILLPGQILTVDSWDGELYYTTLRTF